MSRETNQKILVIAPLVVVTAILLGWMAFKHLSQDQATVSPLPVSTQDPASDGEDSSPGTGPAATNMSHPSVTDQLQAYADDPSKVEALRDSELARLESAHRLEQVDAAWKSRAEAELTTTKTSPELASGGITPATFASDCRSKTCRVTASFGSYGEAQDWAGMFTTLTGNTFRQTQMLTVPGPNGTTEVRIYGARR